jgi:O-antigen ligase
MPPSVALLLCLIFVYFLLRLERTETPRLTRALWIPTIWMLTVAGKPLSIWLGQSGSDDLTGSPFDRFAQLGFLCLGLLLLSRRSFDWSAAVKEHLWLIILVIYMLVSILWSDIPYVSLKRWTREFIALVMAFVLLTEENPQFALECLLRRTIYIFIPFSLLLIRYYPEYGVQYGRWNGERMWVGFTVQKNGLGRLCLIAVFFLAWNLVTRYQKRGFSVAKYQTHADVIVLAMALWLLKGPPNSYPATAMAALAAGLAVFMGLLLLRNRSLRMATAICGSAVICLAVLGTALPLATAGKTVTSGGLAGLLGRDETLTGRTDVWAELLPSFEKRSILGYGFGGFWTPSTQEDAFGVKEAHNGYLDVCLGLGVVGALLTGLFLFSVFLQAKMALARDFTWASFCICFLLMVEIHNLTESSIDSFQRHLMAILLFLSVSLCKPLQSARRERVDQNYFRPKTDLKGQPQ